MPEQLSRMQVVVEENARILTEATLAHENKPSSGTRANLETAQYQLEYAEAFLSMLRRKDAFDSAERYARDVVKDMSSSSVTVGAMGVKRELVFGIIVTVPSGRVAATRRKLATLLPVPFKVEGDPREAKHFTL